ncbi:MAG: sigma-70 family RNA polymerase sigma factor [Caulobacteraceae bacterium]
MLGSQGGALGQRREAARFGSCDEAALIGRIVEGDLRAFEHLYRLYHPRLTRFIVNMIHRPQLAEEVLNDTLLVVWNRPDGYDGSSRVSTWIFAIAYRRALSALRRHKDPVEDKHAESRQSLEAGPEQELGQRQAREVLMSAMAELSADHRAVVDLTYFHELGYREIAQIMSCPVDTVKTRMFHARRHLKRVLAGRMADWL